MQNPPEISSEGFLLPRLNSVIFSALSCLDKLFLQDYNEPVYYRIFLLWTALGPVFFRRNSVSLHRTGEAEKRG